MVTEDVVAFLAREGARLDTRIVSAAKGRFARIGAQAVRPLHARMCDPARAARRHGPARASTCRPCRARRSSCTPDAPPDLALAVAQVNNDSLAALARRHPERFAPLASVPLQDPERAARELERAHGLGLRGVEIPPRAGALDLDDRAARAVLVAAAAALVMPVCIHPVRSVAAGRARALRALAAGRQPRSTPGSRRRSSSWAACSSAIPRLRDRALPRRRHVPGAARAARRRATSCIAEAGAHAPKPPVGSTSTSSGSTRSRSIRAGCAT